MRLTTADVCAWAKTTPTNRNFIEGEKVLNAGHIIRCDRCEGARDCENNLIKIRAYCLQTSNLKNNPHEINAILDTTGVIVNITCTCKAGLSKRCKHSLAVLLFFTRTDIDKLEVLSCTDKKCMWSDPQKKSLEKYKPVPLEDHECFRIKSIDEQLTVEEHESMKAMMLQGIPGSAFAKHTFGRHSPLLPDSIITVSDPQRDKILTIFENQQSEFMQRLSDFVYQPLRECCQILLDKVERDVVKICVESMASFSVWLKERAIRITGSRCYELYTYSKNKNPDWHKKSINYFNPKDFSNKFVKHGTDSEPFARKEYENVTSEEVIQCGFIVSQQNRWLGYSPDGIVFQEGKPSKLLEIKCPYAGKNNTITDVTRNLNWLVITDESITLKKKHMYYGQVQAGMAVLNLQQTDFVIFAPFDNSMIILHVPFDENFAKEMFFAVKHVYFNLMLHNLCLNA